MARRRTPSPDTAQPGTSSSATTTASPSTGRIPKDPAVIRLSPDKRTAFGQWLGDTLTRAKSDRGAHIDDGGIIDQCWDLYLQRPRPQEDRAFEGASDLPTYIVTEKVDGLQARLTSIIFKADPICYADSWGDETPSQKAKVESFHQWQAMEENLVDWWDKATLQSLIEGVGILAVEDRPVLKKVKRRAQVLIQTDPDGRPLYNPETQGYDPQVDEDGKFIEWDGASDAPRHEALIEETVPVGYGPQYRCVSLKNFLFLPGHAEAMQDVFGFAERIWLRVQDVEQYVKAGELDRDTFDRITRTNERLGGSTDQQNGINIDPVEGPMSEKELWRVHLYYDIDGDGVPEWIRCVYSLQHNELIGLRYDLLNQVRYVALTPYPNPRSVYGFGFVEHKLWSIADEHTAMRNMIADRSALATNAPIKRLTTSEWDPESQPWGVGAVLDVRDMNEIAPVQVQDVPSSAQFLITHAESAAERVTGLNDQSVSAASSPERRTATEVAAVSQASYVRIAKVVASLNKSLAQLYDLRHEIWKRALEARKSGIKAPNDIMRGLETTGVEVPVDGRFTAADLAGAWQFKPRGSVETADESRMRADFNEFVSQVLPGMMKIFPPLAQVQNSPEAAKVIVEAAMRLYRVENASKLVTAMFPPQQQPTQGTPAPDMSGMPPGIAQALQAMLGGGAPGGQAPVPGMPLGMPGGSAAPGLMSDGPLPSPALPTNLAPPGPTLQ